MRFSSRLPLLALPLALALVGCDRLGFEDPAKIAAAREAEGKAIGSACRHSGRALEDCYLMSPKASKAAIFAGWREMDSYMREGNIGVVRPDLVEPPGGNPVEKPVAAEETKPAEPEKKTAEEKKTGDKRSAASVASPRTAPRRMT